MELDCQACGACCCNSQENIDEGYVDYVEITRRDRLFRRAELRRRFAVKNERGAYHLRLVGDEQRCAALVGTLGRHVQCRIYALRPEPCRRVKAGNGECLRARRTHEIS